MIKGNDWFTHDSAAKDDPKIMLLIDQMGLEGYGIFWVLIETLRAQKDYKYRLDYIPSLARRYATTQEKTLTVITNYELFEVVDNEFFYSESLLQRMQTLDSKIEQKRLAGRKSGEVRRLKALTNDEHRSNTAQAPIEQTANKSELLDNTILDKIKTDNINTIDKSVKTPKKEFEPSVISLTSKLAKLFPENIISKLSKAQKNKWVETVDKLIRIDNQPEQLILEVVEWGQKDWFTAKNFQSLTRLRRTNGDGVTYFDYYLNQMQAAKNKPQPTNQGYQPRQTQAQKNEETRLNGIKAMQSIQDTIRRNANDPTINDPNCPY